MFVYMTSQIFYTEQAYNHKHAHSNTHHTHTRTDAHIFIYTVLHCVIQVIHLVLHSMHKKLSANRLIMTCHESRPLIG